MKLDTSNAKIFLASQRGCTESSRHRSFHTFNFGSYRNDHRQPFFSLKSLNDETLAAGASTRYFPEEKIQVLLIPLVGSCECQTNNSTISIEAGQIFFCDVPKGHDIEIRNPFKDELINYLYIELYSKSDALPSVKDIAIELQHNRLLTEELSPDHHFHIGMYHGREEGSITFDEANKAFFVFVIEGAFEVNNRLLHQRDGLAIWDAAQLDFEALSNNAIILIVEFFRHQK
jgi:redox-sensitive bicupin YhaK (pirin superfamily)